MPTPTININDLPDFDAPVAIYGARNDSGPNMGALDDTWIIAVIMVYNIDQ